MQRCHILLQFVTPSLMARAAVTVCRAMLSLCNYLGNYVGLSLLALRWIYSHRAIINALFQPQEEISGTYVCSYVGASSRAGTVDLHRTYKCSSREKI